MTSQTKKHSGSLELLLKISIGVYCVEPECLRVCPSPLEQDRQGPANLTWVS